VKTRLKILEEMEAYFQGQLNHLRAMIAAERGQPIKQQTANGTGESDKPFSKLTKAEAVTFILKQKGPTNVARLYSSMKRRGHPVASSNALSNLLSTDRRFVKKGGGVWALAEPQ
jgi:hypothetical protein